MCYNRSYEWGGCARPALPIADYLLSACGFEHLFGFKVITILSVAGFSIAILTNSSNCSFSLSVIFLPPYVFKVFVSFNLVSILYHYLPIKSTLLTHFCKKNLTFLQTKNAPDVGAFFDVPITVDA